MLALLGITWAGIAVVGTAIVTRLAPAAACGEIPGAYVALGVTGSAAEIDANGDADDDGGTDKPATREL